MEPEPEPTKEVCRQTFILEPPSVAGPAHYATAMALVAAVIGGLAYEVGRALPVDNASQTEDAVMIDLPPVEAGAHPQGDDAPPQDAAPASAGAQAPQPTPTPPDEVAPHPPSPEQEAMPEAPPPADLQQAAKPPPQAQAPASAPQAAHEAGAPTQAQATADDADAAETRHASAHLITLWQMALMGRLQAARHGFAATRATGVAKIAFSIGRDGHLVSARVARSSGSAGVDAAALALVRRAAPFPTPPTGAGDKELNFVVPISFRH